MALPLEFIEKLKAANPIEEIIGNYVSLKRTGRDYICLCPLHNEKTPSCHIHPDKEYFYCFGCHAGGDVITFIMKYHNLEYWDAVKMLAERAGISLPQDNDYDGTKAASKKRLYEMNKKAAQFFHSQLKTPQAKGCIEYLLKTRQLKPQTIQKYGMGYAPNSWNALKNHMMSEGYTEQELIDASLISRSQKNNNTYDFFVNRAMFPFIDLSGNIVGFGGRALSDDDKRKYLNSKDTQVYSKNRFLFSMNFAKNNAAKNKQILLCEGNLDVISLNQAGFENAVASCGTALTPQQVKLISQYADEVTICYDSDEAGQKAAAKAINLFAEVGIKTTVLKIPNAKDPDEYIKKYGPEHFRVLLGKSKGAVEFELEKCAEGIDTSTELGKIDFLKKAYNVVAEIKSPTERDLYISKLAKEYEVSRNAVEEEIRRIINRNNKAYEKKEWRMTADFTSERHDNINPQAFEHPKESKAEEGLIYYVYHNNDLALQILQQVPPEKFVTDFNRRVYKSLTDRILNNEDSSISSFNAEFSPDEVGRITEIIDKLSNLSVTQTAAEDCIRILNEYQQKALKKNQDELTNDDFLALLNKKRKDLGI